MTTEGTKKTGEQSKFDENANEKNPNEVTTIVITSNELNKKKTASDAVTEQKITTSNETTAAEERESKRAVAESKDPTSIMKEDEEKTLGVPGVENSDPIEIPEPNEVSEVEDLATAIWEAEQLDSRGTLPQEQTTEWCQNTMSWLNKVAWLNQAFYMEEENKLQVLSRDDVHSNVPDVKACTDNHEKKLKAQEDLYQSPSRTSKSSPISATYGGNMQGTQAKGLSLSTLHALTLAVAATAALGICGYLGIHILEGNVWRPCT